MRLQAILLAAAIVVSLQPIGGSGGEHPTALHVLAGAAHSATLHVSRGGQGTDHSKLCAFSDRHPIRGSAETDNRRVVCFIDFTGARYPKSPDVVSTNSGRSPPSAIS